MKLSTTIHRLSLTCCLVLTAVSCFGQETGGQVVEIGTVTVTGRQRPGDSAFAHIPIDSASLSESVNGSFAELLARHTPVFIKTYGLGSAATVSFRGTAASHTQVEWNGININNPMLGAVDFSLIPVWFVDRAELYPGGSSLRLDGGSLGGSIALNSLPRWDNSFYGAVIVGEGSFGLHQAFVSAGGGGSAFQTRVRYFYERADNDFEFLNTAVLPNRRMKQQQAGYRKQGGTADLFWKAGRNHFLSLKGWAHCSVRDLPLIMSYEGAGRDEQQHDDELRLVGQWAKFGTRSDGAMLYKSELTSGVTFTRLDYYLSNQTELGKVVNYDSRSSIRSLYNRYRFEWLVTSRTLLGLRVNYDLYAVRISDRITREGYSAGRNEGGATLSAHRQFSQHVNGYLLVRKELVDGRQAPCMPSAGAEFAVLSRRNLRFRFNAARNYHQPTLNDLYWRPGGNPDLKPERGYTADLGADYGFGQGKISGALAVTGFLSRIEDWIMWRPGEFRYWTAENVGRVFSRGIEASFRSAYGSGKFRAALHANYGFTRTTDETAGLPGSDSRGRQLIYVPVHTANAMLDLALSGFYLNYLWTLNSERFTASDNRSTRHALPGYDLHNLTLGKQFRSGDTVFDLQFRIDNLLDRDYQAILWRAMPGRSYTVLLKFLF